MRILANFQFENDLEDFKVPYKIYGTTDYENLKHKYLDLSNYPKNLLTVRYRQW